MKVVTDLNDLPQLDTAYLTVGNFDGLHTGHQRILRTLCQDAGDQPKIAMSFRISPKSLLVPAKFDGYVFPPVVKKRALAHLGVDTLIDLDFESVKDIPAEDFLRFLKERIQDLHLYVGYDFQFGKGARGDVHYLRHMSGKIGYRLNVTKRVTVAGMTVNSTNIRSLVHRGEMEKAARMMERPFFYGSEKVSGDGIGRELGFPTVNLAPNRQVLPGMGVYFTYFYYRQRFYPAMSYVGKRPTVQGKDIRIESHILEFDETIPAGLYYLVFVKKTRDEKRLHNLDELRKILYNDRAVVSSLSKEYEPPAGLRILLEDDNA